MSIAEIGEYFDAQADMWDEKSEPPGIKHEMMARLAGVHEGSRVVDVGCGTGIMERAYLELGAEKIVALDVSENMIAHARQRFAAAAEQRLRFECADVIAFSRKNEACGLGTFDSVVIYNAYPHLKDVPELVIAVHNLLEPGGRFLVAHGMGRLALNEHHAHVPKEVTRDLKPAQEESRPWESLFDIDMIADTPFLYFFGGRKRMKR